MTQMPNNNTPRTSWRSVMKSYQKMMLKTGKSDAREKSHKVRWF